LTKGERAFINGRKLLKGETRTMTMSRQKLGLCPDTPTWPSKLEGRANNPGQKKNSKIRKRMKRGGSKRPGASEGRTTPSPLSAPGESPGAGNSENLIVEPTRGRAKGERTRLEEETSPDKAKGIPVFLGDEDLGMGDLKN
jgi:hypothetical protein